MASEIDDPFEGKKLTDLDEPERGKTTRGKGMSKKTTEKGMSKARAGAKTGKAWMDAGKAKNIARPYIADTAKAALKAAPRAALRLSPPIAAGMLASEIYTGVKDPNFMTGLMNMLGGEESAYNAWSAQQAEEGVEMPSYEDYRARAEEMSDSGELFGLWPRRGGRLTPRPGEPEPLEDTDMPVPEKRLEASRRALAPRHSEELETEFKD